ncbi:MAG: hypothetical protein ACYDCI_00415 [Candidatus Limnocylindrales bacterium]
MATATRPTAKKKSATGGMAARPSTRSSTSSKSGSSGSAGAWASADVMIKQNGKVVIEQTVTNRQLGAMLQRFAGIVDKGGVGAYSITLAANPAAPGGKSTK